MSGGGLGWGGIVRLGLVQASLGAVVVLATSTLNRVMVVEVGLPAMVPGILVAMHYAVQVLRPAMGHGSDLGARRTPWIVGGMAVLASGGALAAVATALMATSLWGGIALAVLAYLMLGLGVGAAGTSLLVLLAKQVAPRRRAAAASIVWIMMIAGFAVTSTTAARFLDPFSPARLVAVLSVAAACAFVLSLVAVWRVEETASSSPPLSRSWETESLPEAKASFRNALAQVWAEPRARRFAIFVFVSMLAYSAQELILEPFAGAVFHLTPGESARVSGAQHGGVLVGMLLVAVAGSALGGRLGSMRGWTLGGCVASAVAIAALAVGGTVGPGWPLLGSVFVLGAANGTFAVSAIGAMMQLAGQGRASREGVRMGLWGAAQAVAFACGGLLATGCSDLARLLVGSPAAAYAMVLVGEAALFLFAASQAVRAFPGEGERMSVQGNVAGEARFAAAGGQG